MAISPTRVNRGGTARSNGSFHLRTPISLGDCAASPSAFSLIGSLVSIQRVRGGACAPYVGRKQENQSGGTRFGTWRIWTNER